MPHARDACSSAPAIGIMSFRSASSDPVSQVSHTAHDDALRACAVFQGLTDPIVLHRVETHQIVATNPAAEQSFAPVPSDRTFTLAEWLGSPDVAKFFPREREHAPTFETRTQRSDGTEIGLEVRSSRVEFEGAAVWISVLHDVTSRVQAHERARKAEQHALELAQKKTSYVAAISHELCTPMNGILGMTGLLLESNLSAEQRECADTIHCAAETLLVLLNEILDLAEIEAGRLEVHDAPFSPQQVCTDTLRLLQGPAATQGLDLVFEATTALPGRCRGDALRLHQILLNLLGHAVKFTPAGHVTLRVRQLGVDRGRARLLFEVEDSGIGMSEELLPTIFEPFAQANGSSGSAYGGTGLGLTISQRLLELMGSRLEVRSAVDRGTTFWFELALEDLDGETERTMESERGDVLYVGAHGAMRERYVRALSQRGHVVEACDLSATALDRVRTRASSGSPYRAVFVERQLPDLDGETLGRSVRNRLRITSLPLYLVTTADRPVDPARAARSGFGAVISSPDHLPALGDERNQNSAPVTRNAAQVDEPARMARTSSASSSAGAAATVLQAETPLVLVVEDNPVNQKVVCHMLRKMGFGVELAEDGQQGVDRLRNGSFDLVLMDCQMPVMDGYEATRTIRSLNDGRARVPVVALTANAMEGDREKCLAAGMDDYLSKPAKAEHLRTMLQKWIPNCTERLAALA